MTEQELLEGVATITKQNKDLIEKRVQIFTKSGQLYIYSKTHPYWIKSNNSFTTASGDYQINLRDKFSDFMRLRFMWTSNGRLAQWGENSFHRDFADDTATGEPNKYTNLDKNTVQLHPRADGVYTINVSYYYLPSFETMSETPEEWHHVLFHYVLMMFDPETWRAVFYDSLKDIVNEARFGEEEDIDIVPDSLDFSVYDVADDLRR